MNVKKIFIIALFAIFAVIQMAAQTLNLNYGLVSLQGTGTTNASVIFPANPNAIIAVTSIDVTNDTAGGLLLYYTGTYGTVIASNALSTATNVYVTGNTYITTNDLVVFQTSTNGTFTATVNAANSSTNRIDLTGQLGVALSAGDKIYRMSAPYTNNVGAATLRKDGFGIFAGTLRQPVWLRLYGGTTAVSIRSATAQYVPQ